MGSFMPDGVLPCLSGVLPCLMGSLAALPVMPAPLPPPRVVRAEEDVTAILVAQLRRGSRGLRGPAEFSGTGTREGL